MGKKIRTYKSHIGQFDNDYLNPHTLFYFQSYGGKTLSYCLTDRRKIKYHRLTGNHL